MKRLGLWGLLLNLSIVFVSTSLLVQACNIAPSRPSPVALGVGQREAVGSSAVVVTHGASTEPDRTVNLLLACLSLATSFASLVLGLLYWFQRRTIRAALRAMDDDAFNLVVARLDGRKAKKVKKWRA